MIAAAAQHQDVFQSTDFSPWDSILLIGAIVVSCSTFILYWIITAGRKTQGEKPGSQPWKTILILLMTSSLFIGCGTLVYATDLTDASWNAMKQNMKDKYGANIELPSSLTLSDVRGLDQSKPYTLTFPDGTKGTYMIRFDRQTSEPFITDGGGSPTAQELNQKDGK